MARGGGGGAVSLLENSRLGKKMFRNEIPEHGRRSNYRLFRCIRDVEGRGGKERMDEVCCESIVIGIIGEKKKRERKKERRKKNGIPTKETRTLGDKIAGIEYLRVTNRH